MSSYDLIVVGGGISGVSFAHYAAKAGLKVILIDKNGYIGGCIKTAKFSRFNNFFLELGAHTIYSSYASIIEIINEKNLKNSIIEHKNAGIKMLVDDKPKSLTSQVDFFGMFKSFFKMSVVKKSGLTTKEYYTKVFGEKNYKRLFEPLFHAVICQNASNFPADILLKSRDKDKTFPRAFTFQGGMESLMNAMVDSPNISVIKNDAVVDLSKDSEGYSVKTAGGITVSSKKIVLATPVDTTAKLMANINGEMADILNEVTMHGSSALGVATTSSNIGVKKFSYIIASGNDFSSIVSRDVVKDLKYRGATFHFKPDALPYGREEKANKVLKIKNAADCEYAKEDYVLPELKQGHYVWRDKLISKISSIDGLYITGNYFGGLALEDCVVRSKEEFQRLISNGEK